MNLQKMSRRLKNTIKDKKVLKKCDFFIQFSIDHHFGTVADRKICGYKSFRDLESRTFQKDTYYRRVVNNKDFNLNFFRNF